MTDFIGLIDCIFCVAIAVNIGHVVKMPGAAITGMLYSELPMIATYMMSIIIGLVVDVIGFLRRLAMRSGL